MNETNGLDVGEGLKDATRWSKAVEHGKEVDNIAECSQPQVGRRHSFAGATFAAKTGQIQNLKEIFRSWDLDGTGKISQEELILVMEHLSKRQGNSFSRQDAEVLMNEIDGNYDGAIDFAEFVDWVTCTTARHTVNASGDVYENDVKAALRDLHKEFDANADGLILLDEFKDAYSILQGALRLHPDAHRDKALFQDSAEDVFRRIDKNEDGAVIFDEFFAWQQQLLTSSRLPNYKVCELVNKVTDVLKDIKKIDAAAAKGIDQTHNYARLQEYIRTLAVTERKLWQPNKHEDALAMVKYDNYWTEPPIGLSTKRLYRIHLGTVGLQTSDVDETKLWVRVCVPDVEVRSGVRRWFATIAMQITAFGDKETVNHYYEFDNLTWSPLLEETRFHTSFKALHPDIRLYCMMRTRVDMGFQMQWVEIQDVLREAVRTRLLTHEQHCLYNKTLIDMAFEMLREEGPLTRSDTKEAVTLLETKLQLTPGQVMIGLSMTSIVSMRPLWDDETQAAIAAASRKTAGRRNSG